MSWRTGFDHRDRNGAEARLARLAAAERSLEDIKTWQNSPYASSRDEASSLNARLRRDSHLSESKDP